ncbi:MAG: LacI family transcriptional regulator [Halanaerobiaceae bacterium]|jgi:LacI family transcriptional regulator|nr:LacI family transcriptional regulator [Halanaerobiaceae bacterium]
MIKKKSISIKDVARMAGVSPTTVSRVVNKSSHPVSSETREKVEEAIKQLNYHPNRMAQSLIKSKSRMIGVIVHDISDEYFSEVLKGIEEITFDHDYVINIFNTNRDVEKELKAVSILDAYQADAIVLAGGYLRDDYYRKSMEEYVRLLKNRGCYIFSVSTHPFDIINIGLGNELAAMTITEYLIGKGHKSFAYVNGPEILATTQERLSGFKKALRQNGLEDPDTPVIPGDFSFEGGCRAAKELLAYIGDITAVVVVNDETALGIMWELQQNGIRIPDDISIVGIGGIPASKYSYPPLTTIVLPLYALGKEIGRYIVDKLDNSTEEIDDIKLPPMELVERESVKENN